MGVVSQLGQTMARTRLHGNEPGKGAAMLLDSLGRRQIGIEHLGKESMNKAIFGILVRLQETQLDGLIDRGLDFDHRPPESRGQHRRFEYPSKHGRHREHLGAGKGGVLEQTAQRAA